MNESDYKRKLVAEINALGGGYARRIEDRWSVGALDMFIKMPGCPPLWAEGKIFTGNVFGPTIRQFHEGKRLIAAGVDAVLIGWRDGVMYVSVWTEKADKRQCYVNHDRNYAVTLARYLENADG